METTRREVWRAVKDYEGLYEVSDCGCVRSFDRIDARGRFCKGRILAPHLAPSGYAQVHLYRDGVQESRRIHRMVLETFTGPAPSKDHQTCHYNGVKDDNRLSNLRWGTWVENCADSARLGVTPRGEQVAGVKLCALDVELIRELATTIPKQAIANWFDVGNSTIRDIVNRKTWAHV